MPYKRYEWIIGGQAEGQRVDKYVTTQGEWSRNQVRTWIDDGLLSVNDKAVKANHRLTTGERVFLMVPLPEEMTIKAEAIPLDVVFEDGDVIVVNKPRGMVVHPAPGHSSGTLVNALLAHCDELSGVNGVLRPGIVHRIDKDTSGLMMAAKHDVAHEDLAEQLADHDVERSYIAIVHGHIAHQRAKIEAPIGRNPANRQEMAVVQRNGKPAVTHFEVVEQFTHYTIVKCRLETGRTHQIRVHMAYIGHPLVADPKYGPRKRHFQITGQALHAQTLGFAHPRTKEPLHFHADLPADMQLIIASLRHHS